MTTPDTSQPMPTEDARRREPISESTATELAAVYKALADPVRLRILSLIASKAEVCVCEITPAFALSSATISHHLRTLRQAGLVSAERRGTFVFYCTVPGSLTRAADSLANVAAAVAGE